MVAIPPFSPNDVKTGGEPGELAGEESEELELESVKGGVEGWEDGPADVGEGKVVSKPATAEPTAGLRE